LSLACTLVGCASLPAGRTVVDRIDIEGANEVGPSSIEEKIATAESSRFLGLWEGVVFDYEVFDPYVLERDMARIERFYRARGYYEAHARVARVLTTKPGHVRIVVVVEEGEPVVVGDIQVPGLALLPFDDSSAVLRAIRRRVRPGRPFDEDDFTDTEHAVERALTDRGYAYAVAKGAADVDLVRHTADVAIAIVPGTAAKFGPITIEGLGELPEAPVRRALNLEQGEEYSTSALESAQRAALDLGVFSSVQVEPDLSRSQAEVVPVRIRVEPTKLQTIRLGGGIELDVIRTDFHALAGWESRNFLGGLRSLSFSIRPGVVLFPTRLPDLEGPRNVFFEERAQGEFRQPGFIEARTQGILRGAFNIYPVIVAGQQPDAPVYGYRELKAAAGVDRVFGPFYASTFYNTQTDIPFIEARTDESLQRIDLSYVDLFGSLDLRNDPINPRRGIFVSQDVQLAHPYLRGEVQDVRLQPEVRGYVPISRRVTFALRGTVGFLFPQSYTANPAVPDAFDTQIAFFRSFFSGGPNSNRGYPYRGIGPWGPVQFLLSPFQAQQCAADMAAGQPLPATCRTPIGGPTLWEASAEVRFPVAGDFMGSTFCDASDVAPEVVQFRFDHPHLSCGLGVRYNTPVGPLRLDIGYRLPGLQIVKNFDPQVDVDPNDCSLPGMCVFGLPIALAFGIGEAF
jgi:outer membrane protein insertion porin family/translocation and assembly module TamA